MAGLGLDTVTVDNAEYDFDSRATALTPREIAEKVIKVFEGSRKDVTDFIRENEAVFLEFLNLTDRYNAMLADAKVALRDVATDAKLTIGQFTRDKDSKPTVGYNPAELPISVLARPGVVKTIDAKRVNALLASGDIAFEDIKDARVDKSGKAASVKGPGEIKVTL